MAQTRAGGGRRRSDAAAIRLRVALLLAVLGAFALIGFHGSSGEAPIASAQQVTPSASPAGAASPSPIPTARPSGAPSAPPTAAAATATPAPSATPRATPAAASAASPTAAPTTTPAPAASPRVTPTASPTASPTAASAPQNGPKVPILVKFKASASQADKDDANAKAGGQVARKHDQIRTHEIQVPAAQVDHILSVLRGHAAVERADVTIKLGKASTPNDPGYAQQWNLPKIGWDQAYGSVAISGTATIAVLDTGIDATHPDLAGRIVAGQSEIGGNASSDPNGHGTALAGIAAANVNNATGIAGVAYAGASLSSVQVLGPDGTGLDSDIVAGVLWAADNGADVILMGFSSQQYSNALNDALAYAWGKGVTLVAATGNDGTNTATYPAGMANVIGVASTDQSDALVTSSNTGSANVAAPGVAIPATGTGGAYVSASGTSAAAAEVAGLAALLVAKGNSNGAIFNQIRGATDPVAGRSFGRINVAKALGATASPPPTPAPTPTPVPTPTPAPGASPTPEPTYTAAGDATSTTVTASPNPVGAGSQLTLKATVMDTKTNPVSPVTAGTVTFYVDPNNCNNPNSGQVGQTNVVNTGGVFSLTISSPAVGNHTICAQYVGNGSFNNSSGTATLTVDAAPTFTSITPNSLAQGATSQNLAVLGTGFRSGAAVSFSGSGITVNSTIFTDAQHLTVNVTVGSSATVGSRNLTITNTDGGTVTANNAFNVTSGITTTTTAVSSSANPSTFGQSVTFTATITPADATGSVIFTIDGTASSAIPVSTTGGVTTATTSTSSLTVSGSPHTVSAAFTGTGSYGNSSGALSPSQTVNRASTTTAVTSNANPSTFGQSVSFTATVSAVSPGAGTPTGTVQFTIDGSNVGSPVALSGTSATSGSTSTLSVANHPVTAIYSSDTNFTASTGTLSGGQTVNPGTATHFSVTAPATATAGTPVTVTVTALDAGGNTATGYTGKVHFSSSDGQAGLPADYTFTTGAGADNGTHNFSVTFNTAGNQTVTATDTVTSSITGTSANVSVGAGAATQLVFGQQPTNAAAATTIAPAVTVKIEDASGNVVTSDNSTSVAIAITSGTGTIGATLSGATSQIASAGVATFNNLSIDKAGSNYTLTASKAGLTSITSSSFNIAVGAAAKLAFTVQPASTTVGAAISPAVQVSVEDAGGNVVTADSSSIAVAITTGTGTTGAVLGGTVSTPAISGVATFGNLSVNKAGPGYTLTATDGALTAATSTAFNISPANTTTTVTSSPNPSTFGQSVTFTATVSPIPDGGTVQFQIDGSNYGSPVAVDSAGKASISDSALDASTTAHTVTAAYSGDANYQASPGTLAGGQIVNKADQTINFTALANKTFGNADFDVAATASSGLAVSFTSGASGPCTVSGSTVHITAAGSCTITASQAGNANYNAAPDVPQTFSIAKADQIVTFAPLGNRTYGDPDFTVSATASSGLTVSFSVGSTDQCTISGNTVHITAAGSCTVTASQSGDSNYNAAALVARNFAILPKPVTITPDSGQSKIYGTATDPTLTFTNDGGLAAGAFTGALSRVAGESVGSYAISLGNVSAGGNYALSLSSPTVNFAITAKALDITASDQSKAYGDTVTFAGTEFTTGAGQLVGSDTVTSVTLTSAGAAATATVAGSPYDITPSAAVGTSLSNYSIIYHAGHLTVMKKAASVTPAAASKTYGTADPVFTGALSGFVAADNVTASYSRAAGETVAGSPYTISATLAPVGVLGNYDITYNTANFTIIKADQTITFGALDNKTFGDPAFTVSAAASSGLAVTFSVGAGGNCTIAGSVVTITGAGSCTVTAHQVGDANYNAAPDVPQTFSIAKASQHLSFTASGATAAPASAAYQSSFDVKAVSDSSSGIAISYGKVAGSVCSVDGSTGHVTMTSGTGSCTITANQAGNDNFDAAAQVTTGPTTATKLNQSINFDALVDRTYGDAPFTVSATASSGLTVSFGAVGTPAGVCTIAGNTITIVGAGSCTVTASQAGDDNYNPATSVDRSFSIAKKVATVTLGGLSATYNGSPHTATAVTDPIGLSVSFTYDGSPTPPTYAGSYAVVGTIGDANYQGSASGMLVIAKADPTITWSNPADITYGTVLSATQLNATASFNGSPLAGVFTYTPAAGTKLDAGIGQILKVDFAPADTTNFNPASTTVQINVLKADQSISFGTLTGRTFGDADFDVAATASSGLAVSFSASGNCTVTGSTVHLTGAGSCTITAHQGGNSNYNAAPDVPQTFSIAQAASTTTVSVSNATYDGNPHGGTATVTGFGGLNQSLTVSYNGRNGTIYGPSTTAPTNAGDYTASATFGGDTDHTGSSDSKDFSISPASTITTAASAMATYGDASVTLSATVTSAAGTVNQGIVTFTVKSGSTIIGVATASAALTTGSASVSYALPAGTAAGSYTIEAAYGSGTNFAASSDNTRSLTINTRPATWTTNANSKTYGDADPSPLTTGSGLGFLAADNVTASYSRALGEIVASSPYHITATLSAAAGVLANYSITNTGADFMINRAALTVTADSKSCQEGASLPALSGTVIGVQNGDNITAAYSTAASGCSAFGTYPITPTLVDPNQKLPNYAVVSNNGTLTVTNVAPTVGTITTGPASPVAINTVVNASAPFTDPGVTDTHTAVWDWGDGTSTAPDTTAGTVTETNGSGSVSDSHKYTAAGVYTVKLTVTDNHTEAGSSIFQYVVVYDPNAGYVTGGGWIDSPLNACNTANDVLGVCHSAATGHANFGFSSQYKKGSSTPSGETEFQFQAGNLNFHSSSYATGSLVVSGSTAQYKGTGTINGSGSYSFTLWACDAQLPGSCQNSTDGFRIQIKSAGGVIYDNVQGGPGDLGQGSTQSIGGGSIVIHNK